MLLTIFDKKQSLNLKKGSLVRNTKDDMLGVLIRNSFHDGYYYVFSKGYLQEWHISNIDVGQHGKSQKTRNNSVI
jgi:hypothetical protein